jgi:hypothetical protein
MVAIVEAAIASHSSQGGNRYFHSVLPGAAPSRISVCLIMKPCLAMLVVLAFAACAHAFTFAPSQIAAGAVSRTVSAVLMTRALAVCDG